MNISIFQNPPRIKLTRKQLEDIARWIKIDFGKRTIDELIEDGNLEAYESAIRGYVYSKDGQIEIIHEFMEAGVLKLYNKDGKSCVEFRAKEPFTMVIIREEESAGNALLACTIRYLEEIQKGDNK